MREDEAVLVARLRAGEEDAFREFVATYQDRILTVVARVGGSADAEDLAQETFIKALGAIDRFEGNSALFTWLYRIAVNTARDFLEHRRRRPAVALEDASVDPVSDADRPDEALARKDTATRRSQGSWASPSAPSNPASSAHAASCGTSCNSSWNRNSPDGRSPHAP